MKAEARKRLYQLVDGLPETEIQAATRYLEYLAALGDPFLRTLSSAPPSDEPFSEDDRVALEEGRQALTTGDTVSDEELRAELGA